MLDSERWPDSAARRFDVFLSYNSRDKPVVEWIAERLKRAQLEPWLDAWQLVPGAEWQRGLAEGLATARSCAVFVGPTDLGAWANQEVAVALDRAATDPDFRVFLVLLPGVPERFDATGLSPFLRMRTWVDYRRGPDDERAFSELVSAVNGLPLGPEVPIEPDTEPCPYRGLEAFEEEHAEFFFGREADVQRLLEKLKGARFLAVLGASGSGKSSLVRAGLVPALRPRVISAEDLCEIAILRPGVNPLEALAAQLLRLGAGRAMQHTVDGLAADPRTFHLAASLAFAERPQGARLLLVVDQFEEVFTLCRDEQERTAFFANLLYAATIPDGKGAVLLAMRADFYHRCGAYPELAQQVAAQQYLVSPLQHEGLRQAVEEPARRVGLSFEPGLVATVLEDVAHQPGALPLLEHALLELWRRRSGGMLTLAGYRQSGGVQGAIATRAEQVFSSLEPNQQEQARRAFLRLTQPGEGTEDTRRRAPLSELEDGAGDRDVAAVLGRLVDSRLVTTSRDEAGDGELVEVAHEALIRGWPRLRAWIDEDRAGLRVHRRLTQAAREWERTGRDDSVLYRGVRLAEAVESRDRKPGQLNDLERDFLAASIDLEITERRAARRRRYSAVGGLLLALMVVGVIAAVALIERRNAITERQNAISQRDIARSRELAASAQVAVDPERSLRMAVDALTLARTEQAEDAVREALIATPQLASVLGGPQARIESAAFDPAGMRVVTGSTDGSARVWNALTGHPIATLRGHESAVTSATFSPDGQLVLTASDDGTARLWNASTGARRAVFPPRSDDRGDDSAVDFASFSPDGKLAVTTNRSARIWRLSTPRRPLAKLTPLPNSGWEHVSFSPDSKLLLTVAYSLVAGEPWAAVWNTTSGRRINVLPRDTYFAAFSADGKRVVTIGSDGRIRITPSMGGRGRTVLRGVDADEAVLTADNTLLVATDRRAKVRGAVPGTRVLLLKGGWYSPEPPAFNSKEPYVVAVGTGPTAGVWRTTDGERIATLRLPYESVSTASLSRDAQRVVTTSADGRARVWHVHGPLRRIGLWQAHAGPVRGAALSPNGKLVATAGTDRAARIWDVQTRQQVASVRPGGPLVGASFGADGRLLLLPSGDGSATIWNWRKDTEIARIPKAGSPLRSASFDRKTKLVVTATTGEARVWDLAHRRVLAVVAPALDSAFRSATFSPDGEAVLTAETDGSAKIWPWRRIQRLDHGSARAIKAFQRAHGLDPDGVIGPFTLIAMNGKVFGAGERDLNSAAFSHDGKLVVTAGSDKTARILDPARARLIETLQGHTRPVRSAVFNANGAFIATGSDDGTTGLWTTNGQALDIVGDRGSPVHAVSFDRSGRRVVAARDDGTVAVYACDICGTADDLLALARPRIAR